MRAAAGQVPMNGPSSSMRPLGLGRLKKVRESFSLIPQWKHSLGLVGMSTIQSATIISQMRPSSQTTVAISSGGSGDDKAHGERECEREQQDQRLRDVGRIEGIADEHQGQPRAKRQSRVQEKRHGLLDEF